MAAVVEDWDDALQLLNLTSGKRRAGTVNRINLQTSDLELRHMLIPGRGICSIWPTRKAHVVQVVD